MRGAINKAASYFSVYISAAWQGGGMLKKRALHSVNAAYSSRMAYPEMNRAFLRRRSVDET